MAIFTVLDAYLSYGMHPLLNNASFSVEKGERLCIVGRNGAGKSTLLNVIAGEVTLDDGRIEKANNLIIAKLQQDPPTFTSMSALNFILQDFGELGELLNKYATAEDTTTPEFYTVLEKINDQHGFELYATIQETLGLLDIKQDTDIETLSGGKKRQMMLAKALVKKPDILLLDEPTNHLDIKTIEWLESFLLQYKATVIFISHDRDFINNLATRIIDVDRGTIVSYPGSYAEYVTLKQHNLAVEEATNKEFDKKLAQEEVWIRQGIKARRTRNEGRVRDLEDMRNIKAERVNAVGSVNFTNSADKPRSSKLIYDVKNLNYRTDDGKLIIKDFNLKITKGDKIALIGPNGSGKTTLINLLLGKLQPTSGVVREGDNLAIIYFDQHRAQLDNDKSVIDNLADGARDVMVNGKPRHVIGYLGDFLFSPKRMQSPVSSLSGGEKNRLLLAKILLKQHNLCIFDEPTNDLDLDTLQLLENLLINEQSTVFLVSHDRSFVNNIADKCLFFNADGTIDVFVGNYYTEYARWKALQAPVVAQKTVSPQDKPKAEKAKSGKSANQSLKMSFKEKKDLAELPEKIEAMEAEIQTLQEEISQPEFFTKEHTETTKTLNKLASLEDEVLVLLARWEELEDKASKVN